MLLSKPIILVSVAALGFLLGSVLTLADFSFSDLHITLVGIAGAIVANSTGAGGGVVFMPVFDLWSLSSSEALATSLAIQCFGMSAGSLAWVVYSRGKTPADEQHAWGAFPQLVAITAAPSLMGVATVSALGIPADITTERLFAYFSIFFGVVLLIIQLRNRNQSVAPTQKLYAADHAALALIAFIGGVITAIISVGVGELLVLYLIIRRFPLRAAIAVAVCCSALSVIGAASYHLAFTDNIIFKIVGLAAPGAMLGGLIARYIAQAIGNQRLKVFLAFWIIFSGLMTL